LAVLTISGEHDLNTAPELRSQFEVAMQGDRGVVVDLSPATFVDSSILGVILDARRRAGAAGKGFAVVQGSGAEAVARVLEITGLRAELPVHESREMAEAQASGGNEPGG
jgi:anti-sigma B factor antagonist